MTDLAPLTVIKVGGSLFDLPDLAERLSALFCHFDDDRLLLVAGGGAAADIVRSLQPIHGLSDSAAHRIAMESLRVGEQLLQELFPNARFASTASECQSLSIARAATAVASSGTASDKDSADGLNMVPLQDWTFTSDSIAGLIARRFRAQRLVLVKSVPDSSIDDLIDTGKVDSAFMKYAAGLQILWCDLRRGEEPVAVS